MACLGEYIPHYLYPVHTLQLNIAPLPKQINHHSKILLTGSCFAEHISEKLLQHKFDVLYNPHGILYNPYSIADSISSYINGRQYTEDDLFHLNELWNSWEHHTRYSHIDIKEVLKKINKSQERAAAYIKSATHLIVSLGSAFYYIQKELNKVVGNNHKAPSQWFDKKMTTISEIVTEFSNTLDELIAVNPDAQIIFTVSPVRHIRDGIVENNRSKARLIEAVHELCNKYEQAYYFPSYELVIDVLRDHRYYNADMVHPNSQAIDYVWDRFTDVAMSEDTQKLMQQLKEITTAAQHRPRFPETEAHQKFRESMLQKIRALQQQHPYLQLDDELKFFGGN